MQYPRILFFASVFFPSFMMAQSGSEAFSTPFENYNDSIVSESYLATHDSIGAARLLGSWTEIEACNSQLYMGEPFNVLFSKDSILILNNGSTAKFILRGDTLRFLEGVGEDFFLSPSPYCSVPITVVDIVKEDWLLWCQGELPYKKNRKRCMKDPDKCPNCVVLKRK